MCVPLESLAPANTDRGKRGQKQASYITNMSEFEYFKPGLGMKTGSDIREASQLNEGF